MKRIEQFLYSPLYPLIFSVSPILLSFSINLYQTYVYTLLAPLLISLLIGLICLLLYEYWFKDWHLAALASFITLLLFFSYGHILDSIPITKTNINILFPVIWVVIYLSTIYGIAHSRGKVDLSTYAPALNIMAIVSLLFPLERFIYIGLLSIQPFTFQVDHYVDLSNVNFGTKPDIYYIILDGYGRSDSLNEELNYDNRKFLETLTHMGFKVANCSQSNYSNTSTSLVSAMNLDYLQRLSPIFLEKQVNLFYYVRALKNNSIERSLKTAGYTTVTYASGFPWSELNVDHFLNPQRITSINEFDVLFMRTTFLRTIDQFVFPLYSSTDSNYRQRLKFVLNSYDDLVQIPSPKFVFMHILSSHIPYVIDHNGNNLSPEYRNSTLGYIEQTKYASLAIADLVRKIISTSKTPPIIVIQGDHGFFLEDQDTNSFKILNAYFFPNNSNLIYSSISPVNTFRLILNAYFDMNLPLLDDISYLPNNLTNDNFTIVPNNCGVH